MRVRMRVAMSGTRDGADWPPLGGTIDLPDAEAADLCAAGLAQPVADDDTDVETATATETAERRPARGRARRTE